MPPIIHIEETISTNSYLKHLLLSQKLEEGTIVATGYQTAGRGQKGTSWESARSKNLTFSMVLYPHLVPIDQQFILSQLVSLSIKEVLSEYVADIMIKWPNDIYWQQKKICGILIENSLLENTIENCIIGIGLNINQEIFESDAPNPISLKSITGNNYNREVILNDIQTNILRHNAELKNDNTQTIISQYKKFLFRKDTFHTYQDSANTFVAKITDVAPSGHLILETKEGEPRKYAFKEVKYIL